MSTLPESKRRGLDVAADMLWRVSEWPLGLTLAAATRFVMRTSSVRVDVLLRTSPAIFIHWHADLPLLLGVCGHARHWAMVSGAPYMAPVARMSKLLGLRLARGASGERGREALALLEAALRRGESVELAVDGPSGPAFRAKPGCTELALRTGAPLVALAVRSSRFVITPGRWDRQVLPAPFSSIEVLAREVPVSANDTRDSLLERVQATLDVLRSAVHDA